MTKKLSKYFYLLIFILSAQFFCAQNISQNLIPNGSFEKMKSLSIDSFPNLSLQDTSWIEYFGGNTLFSNLFQPIPTVPKNYIGFQQPQKGNNYYHLVTINNLLKCSVPGNIELQSYAQIKLQKKLRKKK
jgi:hypothetical protein